VCEARVLRTMKNRTITMWHDPADRERPRKILLNMKKVIVITLDYSPTVPNSEERVAEMEATLVESANKFNSSLAAEIAELGVVDSTPINEALEKLGGEYYTVCHGMKPGQLYIPPNQLSLCFNGKEFLFPNREKLEQMADHLLDNYNYYLIG